MPERNVHLGSRLHYPVTVARLLKNPGDEVKKQDHLMMYKFHWKRMIDDETWSDETTYTELESPADGVIKEWRIKEGDVIHADQVGLVVEESCAHDTQLYGMCTACGADLTEANWASETVETERASINMSHDHTGLKVSHDVARKTEHNTQKNLLRHRKLSLVVDLDQTIIHACVDPTIEKWQKDPSSPNHSVVQDIRSFWLDDATGGQTYYIKLRPGLQEFLEEVSQMYEMHVYTMGTRAYAQNIARFIDPDRKLFGNRVISRNENGGNSIKQLQRLFPVSTDMVVIIDDRSDVWPRNERNLIKVVPFDFFKGQGDLNSPFAPHPQTAPPSAPSTDEQKPADTNNGEATADTKQSPLETLAKIGAAEDDETLSTQKEEHEKAVEKQLVERPLMHMQEELDKESGSDANNSPDAEHRPQLLVDDDEELIALQDHLTDVHKAFYESYDRARQERKETDKPQHLPGQSELRRKSTDDGVDLSLVPDVGDIMTELKSSVFEGLVLVLSGLVPLGVKVEDSEVGRQALSFGAQILDEVSGLATHLVVATSRPRTKKVQQAAKIPSIRIVNQNWLTDCLSQWRRLNEGPYLMNVHDAPQRREDVSDVVSEDDGDINAANLDVESDWELGAFEEADELLNGDSSSDDDDEEGDNDSDRSDSEMGETGSVKSGSGSKGVKRKTLASTDESDTESVLAKKQRLARSRGASTLRSVRTPNGAAEEDADDAVHSSLPTPGPTGDEEDEGGNPANLDNGDDFDEDQLEADLLAEFEAEDA
ncbi:NLI interacting factor-like phosphatase domain-containing protein [Sarocladium implicatum]|nr:NLI interacting factor-like phosphatase domain-containing protein [Sarocladium implicatum]